MKKAAKALVVFFVCIPTAFTKAADMPEGTVYVHTARNSPKIAADGVKVEAASGIELPARNLEFKCGKGQSVFLVLSNKTVVFAGENSEIKIDYFRQAPPLLEDSDGEIESSHSECSMEISKGTFYVIAPRLRPKSAMKLKTPFGNFDLQSAKFFLKISDNGAKISLVEGQSSYKSLEGKTDFLKSKQNGTVVKTDAKSLYPLKISYMTTIEEDIMKNSFALCKNVSDSVVFKFGGGKPQAERIVRKEFLMRRSESDYRK